MTAKVYVTLKKAVLDPQGKAVERSLAQLGFPQSAQREGTPEQFAAAAAGVKRHAQDAGRDPASLDFAYSASGYNDQEAERLPNGARRPLTLSALLPK